MSVCWQLRQDKCRHACVRLLAVSPQDVAENAGTIEFSVASGQAFRCATHTATFQKLNVQNKHAGVIKTSSGQGWVDAPSTRTESNVRCTRCVMLVRTRQRWWSDLLSRQD
jgi:hypothetical protein